MGNCYGKRTGSSWGGRYVRALQKNILRIYIMYMAIERVVISGQRRCGIKGERTRLHLCEWITLLNKYKENK